jgi:two-component system sensor histidine kinase KdpD
MARHFDAVLLALYVERSAAVDQPEKARADRNLALARELGAEVMTTTDEDFVRGVLRVAGQRNVTDIVVGKSRQKSWLRRLARELMVRRLLRKSGEIDVHVMTTAGFDSGERLLRWPSRGRLNLLQYLAATGVVAVAVVVNLVIETFQPHRGEYSTALILLLAVVVLASFLDAGPTLMAATLSALVWDYFFLPPRFAFRVNQFEDTMLLALYFVVAIAIGQLTARLRAQKIAEREREDRATALYLLARELTEATELDEILRKVVERMQHVFEARIAVILAGQHGLAQQHPASTFRMADGDRAVAAWAFEHRESAGKFTEHEPSAEALYVPLRASTGAVGVLGLRFGKQDAPSIHQRNLLDAFCQQVALALERHRLRAASENSKLLAESERLSRNLLNSMSHEIRTPIAVITSAAGNLVEFQEPGSSESQKAMIMEIQEATARLNRLVGNVLDITRLESGHLKPRLELCDVRDLVQTAVRETRKELLRHRLTVELPPDLPLVRLDFVLTLQTLTNLLSNAASHTPPGTEVRLSARVDGALTLTVADRGPGIPAEALPRIFEKFYRGPNAPTGGTGLGLSLVKGFIEAQGGEVQAGNAPAGGGVFTLRLPLDKPVAVAAN